MLKGVLFSLTASFLFGCLYYLAIHLRPLVGESVFGIRMVLTLPCLFLALLLFKKWNEFSLFLQRLKREPKLFLVIFITSVIVGGQMWLFLWAPNSGKAIEVSMGYLLMPIVMVAFGKIVYKEPLSRNKWLAIIFAFIGVVSNIILAGKLSLESVFVCTGYPIYFYLRRKFGLSHLHSFIFEIAAALLQIFSFIINSYSQQIAISIALGGLALCTAQVIRSIRLLIAIMRIAEMSQKKEARDIKDKIVSEAKEEAHREGVKLIQQAQQAIDGIGAVIESGLGE